MGHVRCLIEHSSSVKYVWTFDAVLGMGTRHSDPINEAVAKGDLSIARYVLEAGSLCTLNREALWKTPDACTQLLLEHGLASLLQPEEYRLILERPGVQEKRQLAMDFPDNQLARVAINQAFQTNAVLHFRSYYDQWVISARRQGFIQPVHTEPEINALFRAHCNEVWAIFNIRERRLPFERALGQFLIFSLGRHSRVGKHSPVSMVVDDVMGIIKDQCLEYQEPTQQSVQNPIGIQQDWDRRRLHVHILQSLGLALNFQSNRVPMVTESGQNADPIVSAVVEQEGKRLPRP